MFLCVWCIEFICPSTLHFIVLLAHMAAWDKAACSLAYRQRHLFISSTSNVFSPFSHAHSLSLWLIVSLSLFLSCTCCLSMSLLTVLLSLNIYTHSCTGWEDRLQGSTIRNYKIQGSPGRGACAEDRHQGGCILNTAGRMQMLAFWCLTTLSRHSFLYDFPPLSRLITYLCKHFCHMYIDIAFW